MLFLKGGHGVRLRLLARVAPFLDPPSGAHFRHLASSWRSWPLSWLILALSVHILSPSCSKMAPRSPNIAPRCANIASERAPRSKKTFKSDELSSFFWFSPILERSRPRCKKSQQDAPKSAPSTLQVRLLGHILAPSWPTWRHLGSNLAHLGAKMRPNRHPNGAPDAPQIASWAILAPRGSPMSSKVPLESQFSPIFLQFWSEFNCFSKQLPSISSPELGTVAAWRAQRIGYIKA